MIPVVEVYCAFCDPAVLEAQAFYEDELVIALYTHKPIFPGHCLVIPRRHVERYEALSDDEMLQIGRVVRKVDAAAQRVFGVSSYLLAQKNGVEVGQSEPHIHFHYIPRQQGDDSTLKFLYNAVVAKLFPPITREEMSEQVSQLKANIK
jgi:diadenosine tetraphosphate (Ap4A) HIT family hydrolase